MCVRRDAVLQVLVIMLRTSRRPKMARDDAVGTRDGNVAHPGTRRHRRRCAPARRRGPYWSGGCFRRADEFSKISADVVLRRNSNVRSSSTGRKRSAAACIRWSPLRQLNDVLLRHAFAVTLTLSNEGLVAVQRLNDLDAQLDDALWRQAEERRRADAFAAISTKSRSRHVATAFGPDTIKVSCRGTGHVAFIEVEVVAGARGPAPHVCCMSINRYGTTTSKKLRTITVARRSGATGTASSSP